MRAIARVLAAACLLPVLALAPAGVAQQDRKGQDQLGRELDLNDAVKSYVEASGTVAVYRPEMYADSVYVQGGQPETEADAEADLVAALKTFRLLPAKLNGFLQIVPMAEPRRLFRL